LYLHTGLKCSCDHGDLPANNTEPAHGIAEDLLKSGRCEF
jgi:hypothetical protein